MGGKNQKTYTAPEPSKYAGPGAGQGTKLRPEMEKLISKSEKIDSWEFYNKGLPESGKFHPDRPAASFSDDFGSKRDPITEAAVTYNIGDIPKGIADLVIGGVEKYRDMKKKKN